MEINSVATFKRELFNYLVNNHLPLAFSEPFISFFIFVSFIALFAYVVYTCKYFNIL